MAVVDFCDMFLILYSFDNARVLGGLPRRIECGPDTVIEIGRCRNLLPPRSDRLGMQPLRLQRPP